MRIFIAFECFCEPFDILQNQTVQTVKLMIKNYFHLQLSDDKRGHRYLDLMYAGASLKDDWVLADVGITPCCTIKCILKEEDKPVLQIYNVVTQETIPIMGKIFLLSTTVSNLKSLVSLKCGFPVSTFCLRTQSQTELYNCNKLEDYRIDIGTTLHLDIWDGWKAFLTGCVLGHKRTVQRYFSDEEPVMKFQQRIALYMAAFFGHLEMTGWLLKLGVRADEPVGVHPYREWCHEMDHPEIKKCPVHAAAEAGQLLVLKTFINSNVLCLDCKNPQGHNPLKLSVKYKHKKCVLYFTTKMWSVVSYPGASFPMGIYIKLKKWLYKVQQRLLFTKLPNLSTAFKTQVGDTVLIDGFTEPGMTSKPKSRTLKKEPSSKSCTLPPLLPNKENNQGAFKQWTKSLPCMKLPPVEQKPEDNKAQLNKNKKVQTADQLKKDESINKNIWKAKVPLPPISRDTNPRPHFFYNSSSSTFLLTSSLDSFSEYSGRTTRENAIYCLALTSAFEKKPWLQQLEMARSLARRTV
uniref:Ankyrin repeat and ubiquitin domain containing 1 n=2 Tax=Latimeria chalumnae TaxID=7897 RepID=H3A5F5_LATCH